MINKYDVSEFILYNDRMKEWLEFTDGKSMPLITFEEFGELMQAVSKIERGKGDFNNLREEIRDAIISIGLLCKYYEIDVCDINDMIKEKQFGPLTN